MTLQCTQLGIFPCQDSSGYAFAFDVMQEGIDGWQLKLDTAKLIIGALTLGVGAREDALAAGGWP